jgi:hypothetical protein
MADAAEFYAELVRERGGPDALSLIERTIARQLAGVLAADGGNPSAISSLMALLPPATKPAVTPMDLTRLSDTELLQLEYLVARGQGIEQPPPQERQRSHRELMAEQLARRLDAAERDTEHGRDIVLAERERIDLLNDVMMLLAPLVPRQLFGVSDLETELHRTRSDLEAVRVDLQTARDALSARGGTPTTDKVTDLATRRAAALAQAPTVRTSNIDQINRELSYGGGYGGLHDPLGSIYSRDPVT